MNLIATIKTTALLFIATIFSATAQTDQVFIYGKLTTIDGETYQGQIRWGKEEAYWTDLFNGTKEENDNYRYLSREDRDKLRRNYRRKSWSWNGVRVSSGSYQVKHEFQCRFGDIQTLEVNRENEVALTLRNGEKFYIQGGSNDFGAKVNLMDPELGKVTFNWSRIDKIEFADTPKNLPAKFGEPIYGTVTFYGGEYTGYIQWDHDERISTDKLDGDTRDGDLSIEFGKIKSIKKEGSGSEVVTRSGRELYLRGSNDVNQENRGIIVTTDFGRVDIPWREFKKVEFKNAPNKGKGYADYAKMEKLSGTIQTVDGQSLSGTIIYDLDETYSFEMLQGKEDDVEYIIPMSSVKQVIPKNYDNSMVILKNGTELLLGEARDVSEKNDGVLVFNKGDNDPTYIIWEDIKEIIFN